MCCVFIGVNDMIKRLIYMTIHIEAFVVVGGIYWEHVVSGFFMVMCPSMFFSRSVLFMCAKWLYAIKVCIT